MSDFGIRFTPGQEEAIRAFGRDLCVSAGAGSGKTRVLVERFLWAVTEKGIEPDRILAITFTEKAANEMKERLVAMCRQRQLRSVRRKLETAYISTIHSFCSRLLKENPIEAGVDPAFNVLAESEAEVLLNRVLDRLFEEESLNERWIRLLAAVGEENVRAAIKKFYSLERALEGKDAAIFKSDSMAGEQKKAREKAQRALEELGMKERREVLGATGKSGWDKIDRILSAREGLRAQGQDKERIREAKALIDACVALAVQGFCADYKKTFEEIFLRFKEAYEAEKKAMAAYDFDDLLCLAWRLLNGDSTPRKAVLGRLREKFAVVLVDEYQDTSALQDKIIRRLKGVNNLFIVGDKQQSIYGFRYADSEAFEAHLKDAANQHIRLGENFRSARAILKFVNALFEKMAPAGDFQPLRACRNFKTAKTHAVELLCVGLESNLDAARVTEARSVARRIEELHAAGTAYGDIAILFRSLSKSYLYEKELSDLGVPYRVTQGRGFFEKPEVLDLVNFMKIVENPSEDITLAAVLRSPLAGVSDDALFWLARAKRSPAYGAGLVNGFERFEAIREIPESDRKKLSGLSRLLGELRARKNSLKLSQILQMVLSQTDYEAKILTRPDGLQRLANVRKLWELARGLEDKNILGIDEFVRYLQNLSEREVTEPEARVAGEKSRAVTLSTIHAAKGLEFPCVIVADLGRRENNRSEGSFLALPGEGLGMKLKHPRTGKSFADLTYKRIDEKISRKETAEEDRLLYVALTRAEDHLILSGAVEPDPKTKELSVKPSCMKRVAHRVGWTPSSMPGSEIEFEGVKIRFCPIHKQAAKKVAVRSFDEKALKELVAQADGAGEFAERFERVTKPYYETRDRTVTDLVEASPAAAKGGSGLLLPVGFNCNQLAREDLTPLRNEENLSREEGEPGTPADEFGTLFHRFMQYLAQGRPKNIRNSDFKSPLFERLSGPEKTRLREGVLGFWQGPWGEALRQAQRCYSELPFIYKTPGGLLKGQIDLVYQSKDGRWTVLDYKTHAIARSQKDAVAAQYAFQLGLYALVFRKLYGEAPRRGVLYFSSIHEAVETLYSEKDFTALEDQLHRHFEVIDA